MAFKRNYYERKQVKHRAKYGRLEKRSELISRLKKIKENKKVINDAKNEIENVTGKEYFFKYNSLTTINGKLSTVEYDTQDELTKKKIFVDEEIMRIEKKLLTFQDAPQNKKYIFDEDGNKVEVKRITDTSVNEEHNEYKKYLKQLIETKKEINNKIYSS